MSNTEIIANELKKLGIEEWGVCGYENALPLLECRAKERIPKNAKSIILCLFPYYIKESGERNLSYYACVKDYHKVILPCLSDAADSLESITGMRFEPFCDNSPVREVYAAALAGLGVIGDNGLLINQKYGSFVFIGELVTDMELTHTTASVEGCFHCSKCAQACPSNNLPNFQKENCLSYITQKKGELSPEEKNMIYKSKIAWGCDECQLCCPLNSNKAEKPFCGFCNTEVHFLNPENVNMRMNDGAFAFRGDKPIKRNLGILNSKQPF